MTNRKVLSFARRISRKISNERQNILETFLPTISINKENAKDINIEGFKELHMEIGFGTGEHFVKRAEQSPEILFLGFEPFINGASRVIKEIKEKAIKNIRIYPGDVHDLLEFFQDSAFNEIWILFPDPWPKKKHHKRRIINQDFLSLVSSKLKEKGNLIIATDHLDYSNWIIEHINKSEKFILKNADNIQEFPNDWIPSKYYQKATQKGLKPFYFNCKPVMK
jgi:tRNA (guanine-N7-)-methyltransferase